MATSALTILQTINYAAYDSSGRSLLGTTDIELPDFKFLEADIQGAGIAGKFSMPTLGHTDSVEMTLNWRNITEELLSLSSQKVTDLLLYSAQQIMNYGAGVLAPNQVKINFRGISKNTTLGKLEPGSATDSKNVFETLYLKISIKGVEKLLFDKINFIYRENGVDRLADVRAALAM